MEKWWHSDFYPKVLWFANHLIPVKDKLKVATGPFAIGDPQVTLSHMECLPQSVTPQNF
jgi:hypothetical protein